VHSAQVPASSFSLVNAIRLTHSGLVAFDAGTKLKVDASTNELPSRLVVAPWGTHQTSKGKIAINDTTARALPGNQKLANFDRVALDFNHNTVPGSESYQGEPAKVAAFATPSVSPGEGIVFNNLDWTPEGKDYVAGKHYIDLSPTLQLNSNGEATFIHSAAVCRNGAIPNLSLFSADPLGAAVARDPQFKDWLVEVSGIDPNAVLPDPVTQAKFKALLCSVLGLNPDTATDSDIESAACALPDRIEQALSGKAVVKPFYQLYSHGLHHLSAQITQLGADEVVRHQLGISPEKWNAYNQSPLKPFNAAAAATGAAEAEEQVRQKMGISKEAWENAK